MWSCPPPPSFRVHSFGCTMISKISYWRFWNRWCLIIMIIIIIASTIENTMMYYNYLKTKKQKHCFNSELFVVQVLISQWSDLSGSSLDQIWITPHYTVWENLSHKQVNPRSLIAAQCSTFRSEEHKGTSRIVHHQVCTISHLTNF